MKISELKQIIKEEIGKVLKEEALSESVTEEEIVSAIKLMAPAAKAAGFQLHGKVNTKPGKRLTSHAVWTTADEQHSGRTPSKAIYLLWAKPYGLYVSVSQRGEFPISGKPKDWANKLKWEKAFELKEGISKSLNEINAAQREMFDRMDGLANIQDMKMFNTKLKSLVNDWYDEGFEIKEIKEYINFLIDEI